MALTRSFRETVTKRAQANPAFRAALVEEAMQNLVEGEVEIALAQIRDVVNATMGFDALAAETGIQKTSLMRMLGREGNPRAGNLGSIVKALGRHTSTQVVSTAPAPKRGTPDPAAQPRQPPPEPAPPQAGSAWSRSESKHLAH